MAVQRSRFQTGDHALLRQINLSAIINHIREESPISRAALAQRTGLNKTTVSSLVGELIRRHFICEIGLDSNGLGRPSVQLTLNPSAGYIISAEVGVDFIFVIAANFSPKIIYQARYKIDPRRGLADIFKELLLHLNLANKASACQDCGGLLGMALGVPGLVDHAAGTLLFAPNLGWRDVPLRPMLERHFNAPIFVDNEANLATLGEHYFGAARKADDVLYLSAGVGLGGGILRNGQLLRGVTGVAGEFGHINVDPQGELCGCGSRGCWETTVSQRALFRYARQALEKGCQSVLREMTHGNLDELTVAMFVDAAQQADTLALDALAQVGRRLGRGIASMINALNPQMVVFGGTLSAAWDFLLPVIHEELQQRALLWNRQAARVVLAQHGANACVMGGVATVYQAVLTLHAGGNQE